MRGGGSIKALLPTEETTRHIYRLISDSYLDIGYISRHEYTRHRAVNLYSGSIKAASKLYYGTIKLRIERLRLCCEEAVLRGRGSIKRRRQH